MVVPFVPLSPVHLFRSECATTEKGGKVLVGSSSRMWSAFTCSREGPRRVHATCGSAAASAYVMIVLFGGWNLEGRGMALQKIQRELVQ